MNTAVAILLFTAAAMWLALFGFGLRDIGDDREATRAEKRALLVSLATAAVCMFAGAWLLR